LSGAELAPPPESSETGGSIAPVTFASRFLIALAVLVLASALIWAIWGMAAATPVLLLLALGLIASWIVL
jgi:small-conductance mechanosensitive channel